MLYTFAYMTGYGLMKLIHREGVHYMVWFLIVASVVTWVSQTEFSFCTDFMHPFFRELRSIFFRWALQTSSSLQKSLGS